MKHEKILMLNDACTALIWSLEAIGDSDAAEQILLIQRRLITDDENDIIDQATDWLRIYRKYSHLKGYLSLSAGVERLINEA